jgi:hypothetical protein
MKIHGRTLDFCVDKTATLALVNGTSSFNHPVDKRTTMNMSQRYLSNFLSSFSQEAVVTKKTEDKTLVAQSRICGNVLCIHPSIHENKYVSCACGKYWCGPCSHIHIAIMKRQSDDANHNSVYACPSEECVREAVASIRRMAIATEAQDKKLEPIKQSSPPTSAMSQPSVGKLEFSISWVRNSMQYQWGEYIRTSGTTTDIRDLYAVVFDRLHPRHDTKPKCMFSKAFRLSP